MLPLSPSPHVHTHRSATPFDEMGEEGLKELCPDRYRALLEDMHEEEALRDVHEYLSLIGQQGGDPGNGGGRSAHRRAHRYVCVTHICMLTRPPCLVTASSPQPSLTHTLPSPSCVLQPTNRLALDLYRKCRSVRELRTLARAFAVAAPQVRCCC